MTTTMAGKAGIIQEYQTHVRDCGSSDVQVAVLSARIRGLTEHLKVHPKDEHTRRGLVKLVGRRNRILRYLQDRHPDRYQALIARLDIRGIRTNV